MDCYTCTHSSLHASPSCLLFFSALQYYAHFFQFLFWMHDSFRAPLQSIIPQNNSIDPHWPSRLAHCSQCSTKALLLPVKTDTFVFLHVWKATKTSRLEAALTGPDTYPECHNHSRTERSDVQVPFVTSQGVEQRPVWSISLFNWSKSKRGECHTNKRVKSFLGTWQILGLGQAHRFNSKYI